MVGLDLLLTDSISDDAGKTTNVYESNGALLVVVVVVVVLVSDPIVSAEAKNVYQCQGFNPGSLLERCVAICL